MLCQRLFPFRIRCLEPTRLGTPVRPVMLAVSAVSPVLAFLGRLAFLASLASLASLAFLEFTVASSPSPLFAAQPIRRGADAPVGFTAASRYHLVKDWDFRNAIRDDAGLRNDFYTRYVYGNGTLDHLNDEWSRYRDHQNHVFTPDGLSLVARIVGPLGPGNIESGMLRSRWSGRYGVFEIRMKVPAGRGTWPSFWLNPQDQKWPPEIDVVEVVNNGIDTTKNSFHFLHSRAPTGPTTDDWTKLDGRHAYSPKVDYSQDFHVFSVEWTDGRVRHLVDGVVIGDRRFAWLHDDGTDGGPAHVLVNLAVGGQWPGPPTEPAAFPCDLKIEYVRVWQR